MIDLYPEIEPHLSDYLKVSDLHEIYFEVSGNPNGQPAVFLHGGPGSGTEPLHRRFFDPARYRIVLFDQRGAGKSRPLGELEENSTWDLVDDIERLRIRLGVDSWLVFGGSWGSALALAYAQSHPQRVRALVLRGIFLLRPSELEWFYGGGAANLYPDAWEEFMAPLTAVERRDVIRSYHSRVTGMDRSGAGTAAITWSRWEAVTSKVVPGKSLIDRFSQPDFAWALARIETHYFLNGGFFEPRDVLLRYIDRIRHVPTVIVQGRCDVVCPAITAWELHRRFPEAEFSMVDGAGHSATEPEIVKRLVAATDKFARVGVET